MDVTQNLEEIGIHVYQGGVISALEQVSRGWHLELKCTRVVGCDISHDMAKRRRCDSHEKVQVIGHPAVRMDLRRMPLE